MLTVFWISVALLILFLPIIFGARLYFDADEKKIRFTIYLYRIIRLVNGDVEFTKKRAVIRLGKKKLSYPYKKFFEGRKKLDIFKGFEMCDLSAILEVGSKEDKLKPVAIASVYNTAASITVSTLKNKNDLLDATGRVAVYEGKSVFKYKLNVNFLFNVLLLAIALIKKILEKIINGKGKN